MATDEPARIYAVLNQITKAEWKIFVRMKLKLSELEIEECEENNNTDLREQRFQMVRTWQKTNGRAATVTRLEELAENGVGVTAQPQQTPSSAASVSHREPPNSVQSASNHVSTPVDDISGLNCSHSTKLDSPRSALQKRRESGATNTGSSGASAIPAQEISNKAFASDSPGQKKKTVGYPPAEGKSKNKTLKEWIGWGKKQVVEKNTESPVQGNACEIVKKVNVVPTSKEDYEEIASKAGLYELKTPKGCALILNNSFENHREMRRYGSDKDVMNMKKLWRRLGCDIHRNEPQCEKTAKEMKSLLREMTKPEKKYSFIVIVIMTHGTTENGDLIFKGVDHESVKVKDIEQMFNNQNAKSLHNIPKFFIFQFCRGISRDKGVACDTFEEDVETTMKMIVRRDVVATDGGELLPTTSDMLIAYATQAEHVAVRDPRNGSWFINAITNVFMDYAYVEDVGSMLTKVHGAMKDMKGWINEKDDKGQIVKRPIKAMSKHETSLTKKLHLFPGYIK